MRLIEIGMAVIFIGVIIVIIGSIINAQKGKTESKFAVGGFIGPIPFGFANDKGMLWFVIGISVVFFVLQIVFHYMR